MFLLIFILNTSAYASKGSEGYTPSKLEWLAMEMNVMSKTEASTSGIYMAFVGIERSNEILIYVRYHPSTDRELLNLQINNAKELIHKKATGYGWTSWLKIKEDVKQQRAK